MASRSSAWWSDRRSALADLESRGLIFKKDLKGNTIAIRQDKMAVAKEVR